MTRRAAGSLLAALPLLCAAVALAQSRRPTAQKPVRVAPLTASDFAGYGKWKQVTSGPHKMSLILSFSCVGPSPEQQTQFKSSVHGQKYARVYVNPTGKPAMQQLVSDKPVTFAPGSVIVKAKFGSDKRGAPIELLTVMKKREKGYFPAGLDWEYAVVKADGKTIVELGKIAACAKCHEEQKWDGGTFRHYYGWGR